METKRGGVVRIMLGRHGQGQGVILPGVQDSGLEETFARGVHLGLLTKRGGVIGVMSDRTGVGEGGNLPGFQGTCLASDAVQGFHQRVW